MKKLKILAADRGIMQNTDFTGFMLFNHGKQGTRRPGKFGPLYVFNDDTLFAGSHLGMHPHSDVEIVTIMITGVESHQDTLEAHDNYFAGDVQLISSGNGIMHSGGNPSADSDARHLQIWVQPRELGNPPHVSVLKSSEKHALNGPEILIVSPETIHGSLKIDQDLWISELLLEPGHPYNLSPRKNGNGLLIYIVYGEMITVIDEELRAGDALFLKEWEEITFLGTQISASLILIETILPDDDD